MFLIKMGKNKAFMIASVLILVFIGLLMISSSMFIFNMYLKNDEVHSIYSQANSKMNEELLNFKNAVVFANGNGGGYNTDGSARGDLDNNDDDYEGSDKGISGIADDDGDGFKYKFGTILPGNEENILFMDQTYKDMAYLSYENLDFIKLFIDKSSRYSLEIYDGNSYENDKYFRMKKKITGEISPGDTLFRLSDLSLTYNDIIVIFLQNETTDILSYKISGMDNNGMESSRFLPYKDNGRNFDFYSNIIMRDKDGTYIPFSKMNYNILPDGKRPIAPTGLTLTSNTGGVYNLQWQNNDYTVTGSVILYRGYDKSVDCSDGNFFKYFDYGTDSYTGTTQSGSFFFTACATNIGLTGSGDLDDKGYLSTHSNVVNINE